MKIIRPSVIVAPAVVMPLSGRLVVASEKHIQGAIRNPCTTRPHNLHRPPQCIRIKPSFFKPNKRCFLIWTCSTFLDNLPARTSANSKILIFGHSECSKCSKCSNVSKSIMKNICHRTGKQRNLFCLFKVILREPCRTQRKRAAFEFNGKHSNSQWLWPSGRPSNLCVESSTEAVRSFKKSSLPPNWQPQEILRSHRSVQHIIWHIKFA